MILCTPTKDNLDNSKKFMEEYKKGNYGKNVLGVSTNEYYEFIRIGKLCELVFTDYLIAKEIEIEADGILEPWPEEHRIGADFKLVHSNQYVDIKAANKPFHKRLLIRDDQFFAHIHDLYIGAKYVSNNRIEFWGYISGENIKKIPSKNFGYGKCKHILLSDLIPIEKFIESAINKRKII